LLLGEFVNYQNSELLRLAKAVNVAWLLLHVNPGPNSMPSYIENVARRSCSDFERRVMECRRDVRS